MIDATVSLALRTKLPKILIGATILSLGTTAPEAFVSVMAAFMGNPGLALGNGVGSIIADTGLIFGLTALIAAPPINKKILNKTVWWQLGAGAFVVFLAIIAIIIHPENPLLSRGMGITLLVLLLLYLWTSSRNLQTDNRAGDEIEEEEAYSSLTISLLVLFAGLLIVIISSRILIPAASETAGRLGVPDYVIAATMVALGTSLPELITAITAIKKGHPEITIGNIVGADVLNALFVIGASALASPLIIPKMFYLFHFPAMLIILLLFRIFTVTEKTGRFKAWHGLCFLALYGAYTAFQYLIF